MEQVKLMKFLYIVWGIIMQNKLTYITGKEYSKLMNGELDIHSVFRKSGIEWGDIESLQSVLDKSMMTYFISKLQILSELNPKEYNQLIDIDLSTRTGSNMKIISQIGNYRFQENLVIDINTGEAFRRYFLLDFSEVDSTDQASVIYELDLYSFYLLISEISSAKFDIENNIQKDDAIKYLSHMEKVIEEFIKSYKSLCKIKKSIKE